MGKAYEEAVQRLLERISADKEAASPDEVLALCEAVLLLQRAISLGVAVGQRPVGLPS